MHDYGLVASRWRRILAFLENHPGSLTREIAAGAEIPPQAVSPLLDQMKKAGLVDSRPGYSTGAKKGHYYLKAPSDEAADIPAPVHRG